MSWFYYAFIYTIKLSLKIPSGFPAGFPLSVRTAAGVACRPSRLGVGASGLGAALRYCARCGWLPHVVPLLIASAVLMPAGVVGIGSADFAAVEALRGCLTWYGFGALPLP